MPIEQPRSNTSAGTLGSQFEMFPSRSPANTNSQWRLSSFVSRIFRIMLRPMERSRPFASLRGGDCKFVCVSVFSTLLLIVNIH